MILLSTELPHYFHLPCVYQHFQFCAYFPSLSSELDASLLDLISVSSFSHDSEVKSQGWIGAITVISNVIMAALQDQVEMERE